MRETSMTGQDDNATVAYSRASDNAARVIAYLGPYLFWATVSMIGSGILLLA